MAINAFSNLTIATTAGGTVPSLDYLANKTYVDIGSGNVLKVYWDTPAATNNVVDSYSICLKYLDVDTNTLINVHEANIGLVNEFYVTSSLLSAIPYSYYQLIICVEAISKYGASYNGCSALYTQYISKGSGTYVKIEDGFVQPVMKRSLAFAKLPYLALLDETGNVITDAAGNAFFGKVSSVQDDTSGWTLMQEFYAKSTKKVALRDLSRKALMDSNEKALYALTQTWQQSDIRYEVLLDMNGEIITDLNNDQVYIL